MNAKKLLQRKFSRKIYQKAKKCAAARRKKIGAVPCRTVPRHQIFPVPCRAGAVEKFEGISSPDIDHIFQKLRVKKEHETSSDTQVQGGRALILSVAVYCS